MIAMTGWEDMGETASRLESMLVGAKAKALQDIAEIGSQRIQDRTVLEHKDKYGDEFTPYSESPTAFDEGDKYYEKALQAGGTQYASGGKGRIYFDSYRQFKAGLGDESPNLYVTGELMGLEGHERPWGPGNIKPDDFSAEIEWKGKADTEEIMQDHIDGNGKPQRDPWGVAENDAEAAELETKVAERLEEAIDTFFEEEGWQ